MEKHLDQRVYVKHLEYLGLLEPDQPTYFAHQDHIRQMEAEFTPLERRLIRNSLGLNDN